jgi:hypothetical protein
MKATIESPDLPWPRAGVSVLRVEEPGRVLQTLRKLPNDGQFSPARLDI